MDASDDWRSLLQLNTVLDFVVCEDDRTICEIDKCNARTGEMVGYIRVVCREEGSKGVD